jgi:peptide/nickel transport system substrate-binding protein
LTSFRAAIGLVWFLCVGCMPMERERDPTSLVVIQEPAISWIQNFNPLIPHGARWPTKHGVYEPMMIYNPLSAEWVPWLATAAHWTEDNTQLRVTTRSDVRWSDGALFDSQDVAFTFEYIRQHPGFDTSALWSEHLSSVSVIDDRTIIFNFKEPYVPGFDIVISQPIIPEHVWESIEHPQTFANPSPVATGPFTEIEHFSSQLFRIGKNPHYWQRGKPAVDSLSFPAVGGNEQSAWALARGEVDWGGNFLPAIDRVFVEKDPEHHHYWHPTIGASVFLYPNTTRPPLDQPSVRKAISMAIDRELVVKVAMQSHVQPSDVTGLSPAYQQWKNPDVERDATWVRYDPEAASQLLDKAGFPKDERGRRDLDLEMIVISGWTDWVRALQVIGQNLESIGIRTHVRIMDMGAWSDRRARGDFDLSMGWSDVGSTPYGYYRSLMSTDLLKPEGEATYVNWHRFGLSSQDKLIAQSANGLVQSLSQTSVFSEQLAIVHKLQDIMLDSAPAIPLFYNPSWGEYNSRYFTGFPTPENPYAPLSPNAGATSLLVMTQVTPR